MKIDINQIRELRKDILLKIKKKQLKQAIDILTRMTVNLKDWHISEKLSELDTNYKYMLHYMFEGINDPQQQSLYNSFIRSLYELTDDTTDELLLNQSPDIFYEKIRLNLYKPQINLESLGLQLIDVYESLALNELQTDKAERQNRERELSVKRERISSEIFNYILTSPRAEQELADSFSIFINREEIREREKCLFISALTLNLFHRFDSRKVKILMELTLTQNPMISQRAIVGLIIILQMYDYRFSFYPECKQQLETLSENGYFKKSVVTIIKQIIRSRETEKISKKLTDEIIPEMLRFNSLAGKKLNMEDLMGMTDDFSEKNPEWKKELEKSGLAEKLQEYSNLQMEGADVFHSTFSNLKSFPFFTELSNWFLPFDTSYSEMIPLFDNADPDSLLHAAILNSGHMCNSDKYSFCMSLLQLPQAQRAIMLQKFGAESEEMKKLQKEAMELNSSIQEEVISNQYIQDLYRFFKLHPSKNTFQDIFKLKINFHENQAIIPLISDINEMREIATYCFEKNFFEEALGMYRLIIQREPEDGSILQKIGYCLQMMNDMTGALDSYLQAELISPDNKWTTKRIAAIYRSQKNPEKALQYYLKLQALSSSDISSDLNIGHCYLELKQYDKALNYYFKVELLDGGDNPKSWRPIAWTSFLMKKLDMAQKYYSKILAVKPTIHDYLNAGHVDLALNKKKDAVNHYLQAINLPDKENLDEFIDLFMADKDVLEEIGIDMNLLPMLFDELRYKSE